MSCLNRDLLIASILLTLTASAAAQPVITEVNSTELPRSGRVAIEGTGFGTAGDVVIAGLSAWTSTWTDTRVVAYVPEASPLGTVPLSVVVAGEQSNEILLTVTQRQADGLVRWTFEVDGDDIGWRPALAPDGTLYIHNNNQTEGVVYALAPNGALKWIQKVNWYPYAPPSAGPDGAVYVGSISTVYRISPAGQIDWTFSGQEVLVVPHAGPDGMVYGAFEVAVGAYSLDPATGQEQWSNLGVPDLRAWGMSGTEMKFGRPGPGEPIDRFYLFFDLLWAFSLDGDQLFVNGVANILSHEPAVGSDGTIYSPGWPEAYLVAFSPEDGSILWETNDPWNAGISDIEIGPDDTLYFISDGTWVDAYDPHSQSSIWRHSTGVGLDRPTLSPDGSILVTTGGGYQNQVEFVKAFDTSNGQELFTLNLQETWNPNFRHVPIHHSRISADSATAYVPTFTAQWPIHDGDSRAVLFAIEIGDETAPSADLDGNGYVDAADLALLLGAWGSNPGHPADMNGDDLVDAADLALLLGDWD